MNITPKEDILLFFQESKKHVLSFAGFGELGYQEKSLVEKTIGEVLDKWDVNEILVNSGTLLREGGEEGIALVYRLAKERGIETCGLHPSISLQFSDTHPVSPFSDHVFFVEDPTWGGFLNEQLDLSPTLKLLLEVTDELIVIGGGKHTADELTAFWQNGKQVHYYPAQMNHQFAKKWFTQEGLAIPDFNGPAYDVWLSLKNEKEE
jgi:hypothetical protein